MGACFGKRLEYETISGSFQSAEPEARERVRESNVRLFAPTDPTLLYLDYNNSLVEWNQRSGCPVGRVTVATIKLIRRNGTPYKLKVSDMFVYEIHHVESDNEVTCVQEPAFPVGESVIRVSYTARVAGSYVAKFTVNNRIIDKEVTHRYMPGPPVSSNTTFYHLSNHVILKRGDSFSILFTPKDAFGNVTRIDSYLIQVVMKKDGLDSVQRLADCSVERNSSNQYELKMVVNEAGYYVGCVKYGDTVLGLNELLILCMSEQDFVKVQENVECQFLNIGHKASIVTIGSKTDSRRKVKCYISPRLFQIRETRFLIPMRIFTCRVCNSTKLMLSSQPETFTIDDGLQPPVTLVSTQREVIAATYYTFIQRNMGSVTSFREKQRHFWTEMRKHHQVNAASRSQITINIKRFNLLESAFNALSRMKPDAWKRQFYITFEGELGIDAGGVTRDFFTCLCDVLFNGKTPNGLFSKFKDDPQALVHPTDGTKRNPALTMNHFEFAGCIVGKCLFESALGNPLFVKARFTRSFLAQIIGLRVSWKHFETDDPDLYQYKINYIKNHSISELDLSLKFAEDENPKVVSLYPGGSKDSVNDCNKMEYLTKLAEYRLAKKITMEMKHFLKGLHLFVPDDLLGMFDENELELLMCGLQEINVQNLKCHTEVRGTSEQFRTVVNWFWIVVEEMNQEELSRLIQFVTGSSQIPTGGFEELRPPFLLAPAIDCNNHLPYAHTCFNHLCLPNYDTFEQFQRALMTAINEGSEGVLLA